MGIYFIKLPNPRYIEIFDNEVFVLNNRDLGGDNWISEITKYSLYSGKLIQAIEFDEFVNKLSIGGNGVLAVGLNDAVYYDKNLNTKIDSVHFESQIQTTFGMHPPFQSINQSGNPFVGISNDGLFKTIFISQDENQDEFINFKDYTDDFFKTDGVALSQLLTNLESFNVKSESFLHLNSAGITEIIPTYGVENSATLEVTPVNDSPELTGEQYGFTDFLQGEAIFISQEQLLQGYTDVDSDRLQITELDITKLGGTLTFQTNPDGWLFTPHENFTGNLDFSYKIQDNNGGFVSVNNSLNIVEPDNIPPTLEGKKAILANGTEDTSYTINASDLLQGYSDSDGDTLSVDSLSATNGSLTDNNNGTWTFSPNADYNGTVDLTYNVVDGNGGSVAATQSFNLQAVNDAPELTGQQAILADGIEDVPYILYASDLLQGYSDVDDDSLFISNLKVTIPEAENSIQLKDFTNSFNNFENIELTSLLARQERLSLCTNRRIRFTISHLCLGNSA